jgi:nitrite reductase/ring-hydroxylating ferredoxin subunit/uncharacterized membrane protein
MLIPFPFAYLLGNAALDAWARATDRPQLFRTAKHMNTLGLASALAAAVPGLIDYTFAVPPKSSAKKRATSHMFANLSALALFAVARLGRGDDDAPPRSWAIAAQLCGAGFLSAGGWMGGTLVTRNQIGIDHRYAEAGKWQVETRPAEPTAPGGGIDLGSVETLAVDQMKLFRIGSHRVVLARTEDGYVAFDDRCTHRGGPLSDGTLACGTVQCPWHGSQFDVRTGAVKHGPAQESVKSYAIEERDGRLILVTDLSSS